MATRGDKLLLTVVVAVAAWGFVVGCEDTAPPPPPKQRKASAGYNADYLAALSVANEFCRAWQRGNYPAGRGLLSRRLTRLHSEATLKGAIVAVASPAHGGYEILGGKAAGADRFTFQVRLFYVFAGQAEDRIEVPIERVALVRAAGGRWLVDEFPIPSSRLDRTTSGR